MVGVLRRLWEAPVAECAEPTCLSTLDPKKRTSRFCSRTCKEIHHNRELNRGAQLYRVAMAWRQDGRSNHRKGTPVPKLNIPAWQLPAILQGQGELPKSRWALVSRVIDSFIREDREFRAKAAASQTPAAEAPRSA